MMQRRTFFLLIFFLGLGWWWIRTGYAQVSVQLGDARNITANIVSFEGFWVTIDRTEEYPTGVGEPFSYRLSNYVDQGMVVTDVSVNPSGEGTCTIATNLDISCSGTITYLLITFTHAYPAELSLPNIILEIGGNSAVVIDYSLTILYPENLVFSASDIPPDSHDAQNRTLLWTAPDSNGIRPIITFDAGLSGIWLPLLINFSP